MARGTQRKHGYFTGMTMTHWFWRGLLLGLVGGLVACDADNSGAIATQHHLAVTQINDLRVSATIETARMETTLDYVGTRASLASTQGAFLELTLMARGTPQEALQTYQAIAKADFATSPPPLAASNGNTPNNMNATAVPTVIVVTPLAIVTQAPIVVDTATPRLESIVTATGVGADDCAVGVANSFSLATPEIYVVARALNIPPNTVISSRWFFNNEPLVTFDFAPDFEIQDACIWFFIDQTDVTFQAGAWSVELLLNGTSAGTPTGFTILEN